jgi:hypothetical protein
MYRQRYPTVYPPPLSTRLVNAFRTIARIGYQRLRKYLSQRFGQQIATCAFVIAPNSVHLPKHVDMPIASCDFVIARPLGNLHTAREQVATHHQPRNRDIVLPPLTSARLVIGTAGGRFPTGGIHSHRFRGWLHLFQQLGQPAVHPFGVHCPLRKFLQRGVVGYSLRLPRLPQTIRQGQQFDDAPIALSQVGFRALVANTKEVIASRPATEA